METLTQGWKPECGFLHYGWEGYNEATILYVLGAASLPIPHAGAFPAGPSTYQWEHLLGQDVLYSGPLFTHLFSHAWIDFRGIQDAISCASAAATISRTRRRAIALHREHGARNPKGYDRLLSRLLGNHRG